MNTTLFRTRRIPLPVGVLITLPWLGGCGRTGPHPEGEKLRETADACLRQQAAQNERIVELSRELATGAKELVEADAQSRQDFLGLQRNLESSRTQIDRQKTALDQERREIAQDRRWDSLTATGLMTLGLVLAALSPLLLAAFAVYTTGKPQDTAETAQGLFVEEILLSVDDSRSPPAALLTEASPKQLASTPDTPA